MTIIMRLVLLALLLSDWQCLFSTFAWSIGATGRVRFPIGTSDETIHEYFMTKALEQARLAGKDGEVPIGAVIVRNTTIDIETGWTFEIVSQDRNRVESCVDASAHAEMLAMRNAARLLMNWRLVNCTLYSTLEPCAMCLSACQAFRIQYLVYGAPDLRLGAVETNMRLLDIKHPFHNITKVMSGINRDESGTLLKDFFRSRRQMSIIQPLPTTRRKFSWNQLFRRNRSI